jgi:hypothetical protein
VSRKIRNPRWADAWALSVIITTRFQVPP